MSEGKSLQIQSAIASMILSLLLISSSGITQDMPTQPASETTPAAAPDPAIAATTDFTADADIRTRIHSIFAEIETLRRVRVRVSAGVVTLVGTVPTADDVARAGAIAGRVAGVATVQNNIERDLDIDTNLAPALGRFGNTLRGLLRALPLLGIALGITVLVGIIGHLLASVGRLWRWVSPNAFLAELLATLVRFVFIMLGIVAGLEVLGATALLGAVLGGAGVVGIAIGFAVRDTVDNYVSSLMLSLRQPFRANDLVMIEGKEGRVVRLTSRATVLMTLDGNHLRIPNSTVFKAVILNYTRNPDRRFEFDLGIDSDDDPVNGMAVGVAAMCSLDLVLQTPKPSAIIHEVGNSNVVLRFYGWVDQRQTDFFKGRSLALAAAKRALEEAGFALPEPIYRLRFDDTATLQVTGGDGGRPDVPPADRQNCPAQPLETPVGDASPEVHVERLVAEERADDDPDDLLDSGRPIE